jgi:hypothetical protein
MRGSGGRREGCSKRKEGKTRKKAEEGKLAGKRKQRKERLKKRRKLNENNKIYIFLAQRLTKCKALLYHTNVVSTLYTLLTICDYSVRFAAVLAYQFFRGTYHSFPPPPETSFNILQSSYQVIIHNRFPASFEAVQ